MEKEKIGLNTARTLVDIRNPYNPYLFIPQGTLVDVYDRQIKDTYFPSGFGRMVWWEDKMIAGVIDETCLEKAYLN